ncbi:MAG: class I SAM-dependent methyltransferase [Myxococcota bacterium]
MKRPEFLARQARKPSGALGWLIGTIMSRETTDLNVATLEALDLKPTDSVLEIGFGHGRAIERAAKQLANGKITGIDFSETMVHMATRRCRKFIEQGRVKIDLGDSARLPYPDSAFDKVYSVHTIYFWPKPAEQLKEIHRVLRPGGRLVLGVRKKSLEAGTGSFPESIYTFYDTQQISQLLASSGFNNVEAMDAPGGDGHFALILAGRP